MTTALSAQDASVLAKAHASLLRHADIQFSFPEFKEPETPAWMRALQHFLKAHSAAIEWTLWIAAILIVGGVAAVLIRQYWPLLGRRNWRPKEEPGRPETEWRPTLRRARQLLQESDALAKQGLYSEAVHLLLLRSIEDIEERRPQSLRPALTSREIERLQALPDAARTAFAGIARVVERAFFAGDSIGEKEFVRCRLEYEEFAFPPTWQLSR
jgi:hypothetical protein